MWHVHVYSCSLYMWVCLSILRISFPHFYDTKQVPLNEVENFHFKTGRRRRVDFVVVVVAVVVVAVLI